MRAKSERKNRQPGRQDNPDVQSTDAEPEADRTEAKRPDVKAAPPKNGEPTESPVDETLKRLDTDSECGLVPDEAARRLEAYGPNTIEEEKHSAILRFLGYFWGPIPWLLEAAVLLAAVAQRWEDLGVIGAMLVINGCVGFWHENKAQNAIEALKQQLAPQAHVIRSGERKTIDASELVPGDLVRLRMGDVVPADVQLLREQNLNVDESALTGESLPVDKEGSGVCYAGTTVKRGEALAIVTATGPKTKFARTVELVETAQESSHFRRAVIRIGYFLIASTLTLVAAIVGVGWWRGDPWLELLLFAMVLVIAGIPAALPAVLTVTMTVGANRLARMKAIVSRLASMEEMAGLKVLCADKTGTLTKNELALQKPVVLAAKDERDLVVAAALTTERDEPDPIDKSILAALDSEEELDAFEVTDFTPFDPTSKRAEAQVRHGNETFRVAKGAPQVILDLCAPPESQRNDITKKVDELASEGFRALGVARRSDGKWNYLGILPLLDPPRDDSAEVIRSALDHGIDVRMVTGDHAAIAKQVARQVGLDQNIIEANTLFAEGETDIDENKKKQVLEADGFAQVTPEHKFMLVKGFQAGDQIVGMTGDGVNDAPALKQANVGIAVSGATDAARAASDLVLTQPGLGVITSAVEEARRIFERMISYATFRITETSRVLVFIALSILVVNFYPVTPIMIVLLAILNDIPIMTIATDNTRTASQPVRWRMRRVLTLASILAIGGVLATFALFWLVWTHTDVSREALQTLIFLKLLVAGHFTIYLTRNEGWFWQRPWPSLNLLLALESTQVIGTVIVVFGLRVHPISIWWALAIWAYALMEMLLLNVLKVAIYALIGHERTDGS
jgi:H+-transporting ATPase